MGVYRWAKRPAALRAFMNVKQYLKNRVTFCVRMVHRVTNAYSFIGLAKLNRLVLSRFDE